MAPGVNFYSCKQCASHLAKIADFVNSTDGCSIFSRVTNVYTDLGKEHFVRQEENLSTVAYVYCKGCNARVGWRFVKMHCQPHDVYKKDRILLVHERLNHFAEDGFQYLDEVPEPLIRLPVQP